MPEYLKYSDVTWDDEPSVDLKKPSQEEDFLTYDDVVWDEAPSVEPEEDIGLGKAAGRGLTHGVLGLAESVGTGLEYVGVRTGSESLQEAGKTTREYWGEKAKSFEAPANLQGSILENPALLTKGTWWLYNLIDMGPSFAAMMLPGFAAGKYIQIAGNALKLTPKVISRLAQIGSLTAAGATGGGLEGASTYKEILDRGGSEEDAASGLEAMTLAAGALNSIGFGKITGKLGSKKIGALMRFLKGGTWEGLTEYLEEPAEVLIKRGILPEIAFNKDEAIEQLKHGVNVIPLAGVMGGGASVIAGPSPVQPDQPKTVSTETGTPPTMSHMIAHGLNEGNIDGEAYGNEEATRDITEGLAEGSVTIEDVKAFGEEYPALAPYANHLIAESLKVEIDEEAAPTARDILLGEDKGVSAKELLTKTPEEINIENQKRINAIASEYLNPPPPQKLPAGFVETPEGIVQKEFHDKFIAQIKFVLSSNKDESLERAEGLSDTIVKTEQELNDEDYVEFWEGNLNTLDYLLKSPIGLENLKAQLQVEESAGNISPEAGQWWDERLESIKQKTLPVGQGFEFKPVTKLKKAPVPKPSEPTVEYKPILTKGRKPFTSMGQANKELKRRGLDPLEHTVIDYEGGYAIQRFGRKIKVGEKTTTTELPEFKDSGEALTFGKDATPEQIEALKQRREVALKKTDELIKAKKLDEASVEGLRGQLAKEAYDAVEILKEHPEYLKTEKAREAEGVEKEAVAGEKVEKVEAKPIHELSLDEFEKAGHDAWEITQIQWVEMQRSHRRSLGQAEESGTIAAPFGDIEQFHKQEVKQALKDKKPVSENVLAEYPDLKPAGKKPLKPAAGGIERDIDRLIDPQLLKNVEAEQRLRGQLEKIEAGDDISINEAVKFLKPKIREVDGKFRLYTESIKGLSDKILEQFPYTQYHSLSDLAYNKILGKWKKVKTAGKVYEDARKRISQDIKSAKPQPTKPHEAKPSEPLTKEIEGEGIVGVAPEKETKPETTKEAKKEAVKTEPVKTKEVEKTFEPDFASMSLETIKVDVKAIREKTGEIVKVKENAKTALEQSDSELSILKRILECL